MRKLIQWEGQSQQRLRRTLAPSPTEPTPTSNDRVTPTQLHRCIKAHRMWLTPAVGTLTPPGNAVGRRSVPRTVHFSALKPTAKSTSQECGGAPNSQPNPCRAYILYTLLRKFTSNGWPTICTGHMSTVHRVSVRVATHNGSAALKPYNEDYLILKGRKCVDLP